MKRIEEFLVCPHSMVAPHQENEISAFTILNLAIYCDASGKTLLHSSESSLQDDSCSCKSAASLFLR